MNSLLNKEVETLAIQVSENGEITNVIVTGKGIVTEIKEDLFKVEYHEGGYDYLLRDEIRVL